MKRAHALAGSLAALVAGATVGRADCECDPRPLDLVFIIDSTGSMTGALDSVKKRIQRVLDLMRENAPRVRMGIVTYRDSGDEYLRKGVELTEDFPKVINFLKGIQANGGGDTPEAVEAGLEMAYSDQHMHWDEKAKKVCVLVGDAPAHDNKKTLTCDLAAEARKRGIITFTISVEGVVSGFKDIAAAGGGKSVDIQKSDDIARHVLAMSLDRDVNEFDHAFDDAPKSTENPRGGLSRRSQPGEEGGAVPGFVFQQLRYDGDWDPPHAHRRLLRALRERARIDCFPERRIVRATDDALLREPLLYVTGHNALKLTPAEETKLKAFLDRGGTIFIERCCDGETFDASVKKLAKKLTGQDLEPVPATHPVYRSGDDLSAIEHTREHGGHEYDSKRPVLLEARNGKGRPAIVYSPTDVGCGWSGMEAGKSCALRERDALRWTVNIVLYILST